MYEINHIFQ